VHPQNGHGFPSTLLYMEPLYIHRLSCRRLSGRQPAHREIEEWAPGTQYTQAVIPLTPNQATLIGAFGGAALGAIVGGLVSVVVARYTVRHTADYSIEISSLRSALEALANTQEGMKQHFEAALEQEKKIHEAEERKVRAASWKPHTQIISVNENQQHVNKLSINSTEKFITTEVYLLAPNGARVYKFLGHYLEPVVGQNIPIPHMALNDLAGKSDSYGLYGWFDGAIQFTVQRVDDDAPPFTGELKFRSSNYELGNTRWFHLSG